MFGLGPGSSVESVAHVIQVALTPVFLLSGIASLLGVFSGRLARVADRVDGLSEKLDAAPPPQQPQLRRRLDHYRRRSRVLDAAVVLGAVGGGSTCIAALLLFIGTLRDSTTAGLQFVAFGLALLCTAGALGAFLVEMLMASRGIRDRVAGRDERPETPDQAEAEGPEQDPASESSPSATT